MEAIVTGPERRERITAEIMKIAVVKEGFEQAGAETAVNESVREAAKRLASLGATVEEVSIPMHMISISSATSAIG